MSTGNAMLISDSEKNAIEKWVLADHESMGAEVDRYFDLLPDTANDLIANNMVHVSGKKEDVLKLTMKGRRYLRDFLKFDPTEV